jgi:hypothetical protein
LRAAEQERADVARARRRWMREQGKFDPARLVFIDETSANTKMVRLYGRCARGERLVGHVPQGHWKTITFVAALRGAMTGKNSWPMSNGVLPRRSDPRISSCSTISRPTKRLASLAVT